MSLHQCLNKNQLSGWRYPEKFELRCYKSGKNRVVKIMLRVGESTSMVCNVTGLTVELKPPSGWSYPEEFELRCYKSGKNRVV
jgi:hypothetical protein